MKGGGAVKRWLKNRAVRLVLLCYAVGIAVWLLWQAGGLVAGKIGYANGSLAAAELTLDDFELWDMELRDGALVTTGADPQLLLKDIALKVESLELEFSYTRAPQVVTVYWAKPGQDYAVKNMAYPAGSEGLVFRLPATGGQSLRIDPDTTAGNVITVQRIRVNVGRPFYAYFIPRAGQLVLLAVLPGLCAAALGLLAQAGLFAKRPRAGTGRQAATLPQPQKEVDGPDSGKAGDAP